MRGIGQHDVLSDRAEAGLQRFQDRYESEIDKHDLVFSVIDDIVQLFREQSRVERVINRAVTHDAKPGFQVALGIPCHGGNAAAELDAILFQGLGYFQRAGPDISQSGPANRPFNAAGYHFPFPVIERAMIKN